MSDTRPGRLVPFLALLLACGALAAMAYLPRWLPAVAVAAVVLLGGAAVAQRRSRRLAVAIAVVSALLTLGLAGAWLLRDRPVGGLGWTLLVVFALPLPLVPWLYAWSFGRTTRAGTSPAPTRTDPKTESEYSPLSQLPSPTSSDLGPPATDHDREGGQ
jgi:hypothetical protein